jgi:hypothetical protein
MIMQPETWRCCLVDCNSMFLLLLDIFFSIHKTLVIITTILISTHVDYFFIMIGNHE